MMQAMKEIISTDDAMNHFMEELKFVQSFLCLPATVDRTSEPRNIDKEQLCICVLGSSKHHLDLLLEGGAFCPGDVMIALSPDWLERRTVDSVSDKTEQILLVNKAVTFEKGGATYIDVFDPPRRVTYFVNEMKDGFDSSGLDCAMNGTDTVMSRLKDSLFWRTELSKAGISLPPCILLYKELSPLLKTNLMKMKDIKLLERYDNTVSESLKAYIEDLVLATPGSKVIISRRLMGRSERMTTSLTESTALIGIYEEWEKLEADDFILIEATESLPKLQSKYMASPLIVPLQQNRFDVSVRLTVIRGLDENIILSQISATSTLSTRIDELNLTYKDLTTCLTDLGYTDPVCQEQVKREIEKQAKVVMGITVEMESSTSDTYIGPRTDYIDIIFTLSMFGGNITPVFSGVSNQHTCLDLWRNIPSSDSVLSPARAILHVMVMRSHAVLLSGKTFLYIATAEFLKQRIETFSDCRKFGNKIVAVASETSQRATEVLDKVIEFDFSDLSNPQKDAEKIISLLHGQGIRPTGCFNSSESLALLTAKIRELLGQVGPSEKAVNMVIAKYNAYSSLWGTASARYSSKANRVTNIEDLEAACKTTQFPAFLKMESGRGSIGAEKVNSKSHCLSHYKHLLKELDKNIGDFELNCQNPTMVLTELLEGPEITIDIVHSNGQLITGFARLFSHHIPQGFSPRAYVFPPELAEDKKASLLGAAHQLCLDIGLRDGVFNVELMDTVEGPKLIELNPRRGGYAVLAMTKKCLDEDLFMMNLLTVAGIRPTVVPLPPQHKGFSIILSSFHHSHLFHDPVFLERISDLQKKKMILFEMSRKPRLTAFDKVIAILSVVDEDFRKAKERLLTLTKFLGIDTPVFSCEELLDNL